MYQTQREAFAAMVDAQHAAGRHDNLSHPDCAACQPRIAARRAERIAWDAFMAKVEQLSSSPERQRFDRAFGTR